MVIFLELSPTSVAAENLRKVLAENRGKMTQERLSEITGINRSYISQMTSERAKLDLPKLRSISIAMDIYPSRIIPSDWIEPQPIGEQAFKKVMQAGIKAAAELQEELNRPLSYNEIEAMTDVAIRLYNTRKQVPTEEHIKVGLIASTKG